MLVSYVEEQGEVIDDKDSCCETEKSTEDTLSN